MATEVLRETESKLSYHTLVDYINYFRNFSTKHFLRNTSRIGSPGKVVEIDETLFTRRKYNRDSVIEKQWCFGGIEQGTNKYFVIPVERRDAATFLPLIRQYVVPGTTIVSDQWAAYSNNKGMSTTVSTLLILRPVLTQTTLSLYGRNSRRAIRGGGGA